MNGPRKFKKEIWAQTFSIRSVASSKLCFAWNGEMQPHSGGIPRDAKRTLKAHESVFFKSVFLYFSRKGKPHKWRGPFDAKRTLKAHKSVFFKSVFLYFSRGYPGKPHKWRDPLWCQEDPRSPPSHRITAQWPQYTHIFLGKLKKSHILSLPKYITFDLSWSWWQIL